MLCFLLIILNLRYFDIIPQFAKKIMEKINDNYSPEHWKIKQEKKCKRKHILTSQTNLIYEPEIANSGWLIVLRKTLQALNLNFLNKLNSNQVSLLFHKTTKLYLFDNYLWKKVFWDDIKNLLVYVCLLFLFPSWKRRSFLSYVNQKNIWWFNTS